MKRVRFIRDTDPSREGGAGFKTGNVVSLRDDKAARWVRRNAAVDEPEPAPAAPIKPPAIPDAKPAASKPPSEAFGSPAAPPAQQSAPPAQAPKEKSDGNTMAGSADVAGKDGGGAGQRGIDVLGGGAGGARGKAAGPGDK